MRTLRAALFLSGMASLLANAIIVYPVIAAYLPKSVFGGFASGLAVIAVGSPLVACGVHVYVLRATADSDPETRRVVGGIVRRSMAIIGGIAVLLIPVGILAWESFSLAASVFASAASLIAVSHSRGAQRPWSFALLTIGVQSVAVGVGGGVLAVSANLSWAFTAIAIITLAFSETYMLAGVQPDATSGGPGVMAADWARVLKFSLALVPHLVLLLFLLQGARLIVSARLGLESAAEFQFSATLGGFAVIIMITLNGSNTANALGLDGEAFRGSCVCDARRLALMCVPLTICTWSMALWGLTLWLPGRYEVGPIAAAALTFLPAAPLQALGDVQVTLALKQYNALSISAATTAGAVTSTALIVLLAPQYGIAVAGASISCGLLARALVAGLLLHWRRMEPLVSGPLVAATVFSTVMTFVGLSVV